MPGQEAVTLVWADEFDRDGWPHPTRRSCDVGGHRWGTQELQFHTGARDENARVEGGALIIEAPREDWEGAHVTSARVVSKGLGHWTYERIDVRARLPIGCGSRPAVWMLPTTIGRMRRPDDGENDIMEHVGVDPGVVHGSVHTMRQPTRITSSLDGREYFRFDKEPAVRDVWPFDAPFHLVLNVAVRGRQQSVDASAMPYRMEMECVRVHRHTGRPGAR